MKAAYYTTNGDPDVLQYGDVDEPSCGPDDVVIDVSAISIEGGDIISRRAIPPKSVPFVGGHQAAGTIASVGDHVSDLAVGDSVVAFNWSGAYAERFVAPQHYVYPVPAGLDPVKAAAAPIIFGTAHEALFEYGKLEAGETVLVQGASGGVGIALVQLAKKAGATVIGTSSADDKLELLNGFGLDHGLNYRTADIQQAALDLTGGTGVDLAIDLAGGDGFGDVFNALRKRGRMVMVGIASGKIPVIDYYGIRRKGLCVSGLVFGNEMHTGRVRELIAEILSDVAAGHLVVPIDKRFPLREAAAAHQYAEDRGNFGKVMLIP